MRSLKSATREQTERCGYAPIHGIVVMYKKFTTVHVGFLQGTMFSQ